MADATLVRHLNELLDDYRVTGEPWHEFLRVPTVRAGLYVLPAGGWDAQTPHEEDEVYYVIRGAATFQAGSERWPVSAGSVIFVPARQEHRFADISEELTVLVMFATRKT
jgi:mannose-6-phosphate isomerase-like protein (cupin superfamily)